MLVPSHARKWFGRLAVLLGIGALSATAAQAEPAPSDESQKPAKVPQQSAKGFGEMRIWSEGDRVFLSESGKEVREIQLGDTTEARRLYDLLRQGGADAASPQVLEHRIILVGGGGSGFSWEPPQQTANPSASSPSTMGGAPAKPGDSAQGTPTPAPRSAAGRSEASSRGAKN